jgi:diguanylate cyclase (GGDEF)-like protein/PAS domain S-box-containing protein
MRSMRGAAGSRTAMRWDRRLKAALRAIAGQHDGDSLSRAIAAAETSKAEAERAHARLRDAIDILPEGIVFLDGDGRYVLWNRRYAEIYKRSADVFQVGARLEDTLRIGVARGDYPAAIGREEEWLAERLQLLRNPSGRHEQTLSDGRCILIEERQTGEGGVIGLRVDITEMKRREASFRLLFDGNPVPMFVLATADSRFLAVNDAALAHYGYARTALLEATFATIQAEGEDEDKELPGLDADEDGDQAGRTWRHRKADGGLIDVAIFSRRLAYEGQEAVMMAAVDITERKRAEARIAFMAHHDALTLLPNRLLLRQRMEEMLSRARREKHSVGTLCIDVDNFKSVNDTLGHPIGDLLLQTVAKRLRAVLRAEDVVARLGGDEFAILQSDVAHPSDAGQLAERVLATLNEPYTLDGHLVTIGASIGIALSPGDGDDPDLILKNADMALYRAKGDGKGVFRFFEAEMDARVQARRQLEIELRAALKADMLEVHYQPLVNLGSGDVTGYEALIRWTSATRGPVPPSEFIPVAEETGLIAQIGAFVLKRACADAAAWPKPLKVAVNLSPLQFKSTNLLVVVSQALEQAGLAPRRLELEITETLLLERSSHVLATLHALRALGVNICMDDFGTGYSSLSYLRSFPFDKIKIDRSFVHEMGVNEDSRAIVRAIIGIGTSLGITITAEGVENESDLVELKAEGCNEAQGYLFSAAQRQGDVVAAMRDEAKRVA